MPIKDSVRNIESEVSLIKTYGLNTWQPVDFSNSPSVLLPPGTITSGGGYTVLVVNTTYAALTTNYVLLADATNGSFVITLPTTAGHSGLQHTIKKTDASANTVTIATTSSQTIDGSTTAVLSVQENAITVISDGTNWWVI
jgi:hypothetical protein